MGEDCVFCEICKRNKPGKIISPTVFLSTEHVVGFMDVMPLVSSLVHVLVVPRKHYATVDTVDPTSAGELGKEISRVSRAIANITETGGSKDPLAFNVIQNNGSRAGQVVHHVHYHIVLRHPQWQVPKSQSKLHHQMHFFARQQREDLDDERANIAYALRDQLEGVKAKI